LHLTTKLDRLKLGNSKRTILCHCHVSLAIYVEAFDASMFAYSIRIRLLTPEDGEEYMSPEQRGFGMCQLVSRHWKICKDDPDEDEPSIEEVRGDGVIGYYPLLCEGGFVSYQTSDDGRLVGVSSIKVARMQMREA
jgi:uncharacterized protein affecting Mg2+/Co2+ transport